MLLLLLLLLLPLLLPMAVALPLRVAAEAAAAAAAGVEEAVVDIPAAADWNGVGADVGYVSIDAAVECDGCDGGV